MKIQKVKAIRGAGTVNRWLEVNVLIRIGVKAKLFTRTYRLLHLHSTLSRQSAKYNICVHSAGQYTRHSPTSSEDFWRLFPREGRGTEPHSVTNTDTHRAR